MNALGYLAGIVCIVASGHAYAVSACSGPYQNATQIKALVGQSTVCVGSTPNATWSEYHDGNTSAASGNVIDWKKGRTDPVDPTTQVGTYAVTASGSVGFITYTYGSLSYLYVVTPVAGTTYNFCLCTSQASCPGPNTLVTIKAGQGAC